MHYPPACASKLKDKKVTVRRAPVLRQAYTCTQRGTKRMYVAKKVPIPHPRHDCRIKA